ncbi:MAG: thioredoxin family protein [Melioribacteraceae bacterium]|nr:thioredoxin family protein [Melioribacteraceae bacterium]MCF8265249.1 thioredoxin family protein [Melioribacteraceae bacterium]
MNNIDENVVENTPFFIEDGRLENGLEYSDYFDEWKNYVDRTDPESFDLKGKTYYEYKKMNLHRSTRIQKTYKVSDELKEQIQKIDKKQTWMVITEDWCGDSAQILPYIIKMAELNEKIEVKILRRDDNLDIIDSYLTNGVSRSIPKIVAFDEDGNELFQWGPRPQELVDLIIGWKNEGMVKDQFTEKIHLWYARNRGKAIESEFLKLIK